MVYISIITVLLILNITLIRFHVSLLLKMLGPVGLFMYIYFFKTFMLFFSKQRCIKLITNDRKVIYNVTK